MEKYFELCANYILEFDLIRHGGVIPEIPSEDNLKNESSSFKDKNKAKNNNQYLNINERIKLNMEVKNQSIKNN